MISTYLKIGLFLVFHQYVDPSPPLWKVAILNFWVPKDAQCSETYSKLIFHFFSFNKILISSFCKKLNKKFCPMPMIHTTKEFLFIGDGRAKKCDSRAWRWRKNRNKLVGWGIDCRVILYRDRTNRYGTICPGTIRQGTIRQGTIWRQILFYFFNFEKRCLFFDRWNKIQKLMKRSHTSSFIAIRMLETD